MNPHLDILKPWHERRQEPDGAAIAVGALVVFSVLYFGAHFINWIF